MVVMRTGGRAGASCRSVVGKKGGTGMRRLHRSVWMAVLSVLLSGACVRAGDLGFGRFYTDSMVLQRDKPAVVRGTAPENAPVSVTFGGQTKTAAADKDGQWAVTLDAAPASVEPRPLSVTAAGKTVTLNDILVGDVILFARQTSIDISLGSREEGRQAASGYRTNPRFRGVTVRTVPAARPQDDLAAGATTGWAAIDSASAVRMSAAAFHLGRDLSATSDVPIGIVDLNMGPAFPVAWLSRDTLMDTEKFYGRTDVPGNVERMEKLAELAAKGEPLPPKELIRSDPVKYALYPAAGYNAVLHPLRGLALKAAIVQLGNDYPYMVYAELEQKGTNLDRDELNRAYVETYDIRKTGCRMEPVTTPRIPREWRTVFADAELPMGLVMPPGSDLTTLGQHHREMRELQRLTAADCAGVSVILPGSANVPFSAQPRDEVLLARRCLSWVQGAVYAKPGTPATGPLFERLEANFNEATIHFAAGTARGLAASGPALEYFETAGVEGDYSPAKAVIDGESIRLRSDTVNRIARVRYNWNSRPNEGLVNSAGLPAVPFRSERADYDWFVTNEEDDLPIEYSTPANEWKKSDVTLVNGQLKTHGYDNFSGWLGPVGVMTGPFGPNMGVREVKPGSPADGKLLVGDVIYSANGHMLGDKAWEVMADAITESETREGKGKLVLGLRRGGENQDVEVTLAVMGTYSSTAPYDCPKTEKIIANLENWVVAGGAGAGFLNADALFMLATGSPEMQGYVRRIVYDIMAKRNPSAPIDPTTAGKSWHNSAEAILLGEYYLATGDRNVLPYLKHACDRLAATQNKEYGGWRHNFPGGPSYGLIPNAGLPGVLGMHFAQAAGVEIDMAAYQLGVKHFSEKRAESGFLIYGYGLCQREVPPPFDPENFYTGHMDSFNGGISAAGILMGLTGNPRGAHLCSLISAYAWNNTFGGHGGNFWNNFWTPLGAHQHSKQAFVHFWKNHRWYRELNRMYDGSLIQHEDGNVGAGTGVALVAPRRRIQIVGAPASPFAVSAPECLKPAVAAYWKRDYAGCEKLVGELLAGGSVGKDDRPTVEYLERAARDIQQSIMADLARMKKSLEAGKADEARDDLAQMKGIMAAGDDRLAEIEKAIAAVKPAAKPAAKAATKPETAEAKREWDCLVTEIATGRSKASPGKVAPEQASKWRLKVVEDMSQAPEGWTKPAFDDAGWYETHLPISWRMYHSALLRTTFTVKDKAAYDGLRLRGWFFRQQGMEIFLNGELVAKVNNLEQKTGDVEAEFRESVMKKLRDGENTLAIGTRHNWRWGMLSMHVYNDGYGFRLDARRKDVASK